MVGFDVAERLVPFRDGSGDDNYGAILFDASIVRQARSEWFLPEHWGDRAQLVASGGRGGAWFVDAPPLGRAFLRQYLRGGWAASLSRDRHLWRGNGQVRSFAEFKLARKLHGDGLPVPRPIAACYRRHGLFYRAAILLQRLDGVRSLGDIATSDGENAPWESTGKLIARFHRVGLDHADLNAHNILFDEDRGWLIDLDRGQLKIPATGWRERNLKRLQRSLLKLRGQRTIEAVQSDFARLRNAYDSDWARGY